MDHPVDRAAKAYGSQQAMATALGVTKAAVWQWKDDGRQVPVQHCAQIVRFTQGAVRHWELRPDDWHLIWPELIEAEGSPALKTEQGG